MDGDSEDYGIWDTNYTEYAPGVSTESPGGSYADQNVNNTWGSIISSLGAVGAQAYVASQGLSYNASSGLYYNPSTGQYYNPQTGKYSTGTSSTLWIILIAILIAVFFFLKK